MVGLFAISAASSGQQVQRWVLGCDVDAEGGQGQAEFTDDPYQAAAFKDAGEALEYWRRQSTVKPLRADGMPNRPLMAFHCLVVELPQEGVVES